MGTRIAAACVAESHSLAIAVGFFGSAFRGVNLTDAFAALLHHHASLEYLDANVAVVVKIKLDGGVWLQLHGAERAQVNRRTNRSRRFDRRAGKQARAAGCAGVI